MEVATFTWPGGRGLAAAWTATKAFRPHEKLRLSTCESEGEVEEYSRFLNHSRNTPNEVLRDTLKRACKDQLRDLGFLFEANDEAQLNWRAWKLDGEFDPDLLRLMASPSGRRIAEHLDSCRLLPEELLTPIWVTLHFANNQAGFLPPLKEEATRG